MAHLPTSEESGRRVMEVYKARGIRPGEMILLETLRGHFVPPQWRVADLEAGLQWCVEHGYLEEKKPGGYFLTEEDYASI